MHVCKYIAVAYKDSLFFFMKERKKYSLDHFNKSALNGGNSFMAKKEFNFDNSFKTQTGLWYRIYTIPLCYISTFV